MRQTVSLCILLIFIGSCLVLSAMTRIVDIDGTGQYSSIQSGINASVGGDTVLVYPGRYLENVSIQTNNISLISLEYISNNPAYIDSTIIDGQSIQTCINIYPNTYNFILRGFSVTNGFNIGSGAGIGIGPSSTCIIVNSKIFSNLSKSGAGITISDGSANLSGVQIYNNHAYDQGGGLCVYNGSVTFDPANRCSIYNNTGGAGQDIFASSLNNDLNIYLNTFSVSNPTSYYATAYKGTGIDFNFIFDIQESNHSEINSDLYVSPEGNDDNDGLTQQTALKTIHTAVYRIAADSLDQKTVHILPGTYSHTANQQIFPIALKSRVRVEGSSEENTFIIGAPNPQFPNILLILFRAFNESHFSLGNLSITTINSTDDTAIMGEKWNYVNLFNLHIYNLHPDSYPVIYGGQSRNSLWETITIENISTSYRGLFNGNFQGIFRNCVFRNAISTFYDVVAWANPLIGVSINEEVTFENCTFDQISMTDNDTQAIQFSGTSNSVYQSRLNLINCRFTDFACPSDMIVVASVNNPVINVTNCTFGRSSGIASVFYINGTINITNSIFYNFAPYEIRLYQQTGEQNTLNIDYSCFRNGQYSIAPSSGSIINYLPTNVDGEPGFIGSAGSNPYNYHLANASLCIDAGTPDTTGLNLPEYDLDGNPRVYNGRIDMGAYEWDGTGVEDNYAVESELNTISIYPNPFYSEVSIRINSKTDGLAKVLIYNIKGQIVRQLRNYKLKTGTNTIYWDGRDNHNDLVSNGVYVIRVRSAEGNYSIKSLKIQ